MCLATYAPLRFNPRQKSPSLAQMASSVAVVHRRVTRREEAEVGTQHQDTQRLREFFKLLLARRSTVVQGHQARFSRRTVCLDLETAAVQEETDVLQEQSAAPLQAHAPQAPQPSAGQPRDPSWLRPGVKCQPAPDREGRASCKAFSFITFFFRSHFYDMLEYS